MLVQRFTIKNIRKMKKHNFNNNKYFYTSILSFSIWIVSLIINAVLDLLLIGFHSGGSELFDGLGLILLFSSLFSLPGMIVLWIVVFMNYAKPDLFNRVFITALLTSFLSVFVFFCWIADAFGGKSFWLILFAVLSALFAVMLHRPVIKNIIEKNKIRQNV